MLELEAQTIHEVRKYISAMLTGTVSAEGEV